MDAEITLEEVTAAVKSLKHNKTCGMDGCPAEMLQFFWSKWGALYYNALQYAFRVGKLHLSARRGVIILIQKGQKDPNFLKNWRPLTMLSSCYKILAKILALRMKRVLPSIISEDQCGFMEGRQISKVIRTTIDVKLAKKINGYILMLDFEKCFDRIEYNAIKGSLRYFGFGDNFIRWVDLLLVDFHSYTTNNGHLSPYFNVSRSCHQGCPVAPLLFLVCGEVMAQELRQKGIEGISLNGLEHLIAQFADDTQLFLQTKKAVEKAIAVLRCIETNTGLKINYYKTSIHTVGDAKRFECSEDLIWDPGGTTVLGIEIDVNSENQYSAIVAKAQKILNNWNNRHLSLLGKVLIVNTLIASLFVYTMQATKSPSLETIRKLNKIVNHFLWSSKRAKISKEFLMAEKAHSGLRLVDFQQFVPGGLGEGFWRCALNATDIQREVIEKHSEKLEGFWCEIVKYWFELTWETQHRYTKSAKSQIIWLNSQICVKGRPIINLEAIKKGVIYVTDLLDSNSKVLSYEQFNIRFPGALTWLQHRGICSAIPQIWLKNCDRDSECTEVEDLYGKLTQTNARSKQLYSLFNEKRDTEIKIMYKKAKLADVELEEYQSSIQKINAITSITKLRDFQYRLLCNAIFANDRLFHWKKSDTQKCDYCPCIKQTTRHLLVECENSIQIWDGLKHYLKHKTDIDLTPTEFTQSRILLNNVHPKPGNVVNVMVLVAKQHIFASKCQGKKPLMHEILNKIKRICQIEKYNAIRNGRHKKWKETWEKYETVSGEQCNLRDNDHDTYVNEYIAHM